MFFFDYYIFSLFLYSIYCEKKNSSESDSFSENVNNRVSIDSQPFLPPHHSSKINDMTDDLPSYHSDYLDTTTSDSPITFKKPQKTLKRKNPAKNPIIDSFSDDTCNENASKISKTKTKSKAKPQKSTNSKESMNIDSCNIIHKKRRN